VKLSEGKIGIEKGRAIVTIGMFDGVHLGHMSLINEVISIAKRSGGESVAITFSPHPRVFINGSSTKLSFLTSLEEKAVLLGKAGLDHLLVLPFTEKLRLMTACEFVDKILVGQLGIRHLVIGFNHTFGYGGGGDSAILSECADKYGFDASRMPARIVDGLPVSSTIIRKNLDSGNLEKANSLLGYEYFLRGMVVEGKKIGRILGYPTANIEPDYKYKLIPAEGVYAADCTIDEKDYKSMLYIGKRPTIEPSGERRIEVNIFDFEGDLYGKSLTVTFKHRIRGDMKFDNRDLLMEQIAKDKIEALRLLA
jgi:riboflavin kinase / FMN adenylyltransferase